MVCGQALGETFCFGRLFLRAADSSACLRPPGPYPATDQDGHREDARGTAEKEASSSGKRPLSYT